MKAIAVALGAMLALSLPLPVAAQPAGPAAEPEPLVQPSRPRTRLRVEPLYPYRHYHSIYPLPYETEYPGPNAHRECTDRYVVEHRPSGTVVMPRLRCRWVAGRYPGP